MIANMVYNESSRRSRKSPPFPFPHGLWEKLTGRSSRKRDVMAPSAIAAMLHSVAKPEEPNA